MAESTPPPRFDSSNFEVDPRLSDGLTSISNRISETVACLREWYLMNRLGLFDEGQVPETMRSFVDKTVKSTERILLEWKAIPVDANLQSRGDQA